MSKYCRDVQLFQNKFGFSCPSDFTFLNQDLFEFRLRFLYEELNEYIDACSAQDLGTAVDSLIDLVYIACGNSIYHGIGFDTFNEILDIEVEFPVDVAPDGKPKFLTPEENALFIRVATKNIEDYAAACSELNPAGIKKAIASIYLNSMFASTKMGLTNEQWDELWNDVQRANMSKERAANPTQSKRGSTYDIIKPEGWIPPRTEELIQKFLDKANEAN